MTEHLIACLLITHLPVKAELGRYPLLRGRPVVITESYGSKELVLDSSPEARGVAAGMSFQEAVSRCKDAVLLQADGPYYESRFDAVVRSLEGRSPLVEKGELGCAYVGLGGLEDCRELLVLHLDAAILDADVAPDLVVRSEEAARPVA